MGRWFSGSLKVAGLTGLVVASSWFHPFGPLDGKGPSAVSSLLPAHAQGKEGTGSITKLRIQPLYKAAKLSWKATIEGGGPVTFEIYRSQANPEGPYTQVTTIEWKPGVKKYDYVDKNLPVEENYFYRIEIPATKERFGPLQVRPPFSLPTT